jgi:hypothetical protein
MKKKHEITIQASYCTTKEMHEGDNDRTGQGGEESHRGQKAVERTGSHLREKRSAVKKNERTGRQTGNHTVIGGKGPECGAESRRARPKIPA